MTRPVLHQVNVSATPGDAITEHVFMLRRWLRELGFASEVFVDSAHPAMKREVHPMTAYRPTAGEQWLIYHHSKVF